MRENAQRPHQNVDKGIESLRAERTADDLLSLTHYCGEVFGAFETFRVKFVDILRPGRTAANQRLTETTFKPPIDALLPGARVSFAVIASPASSVAVTASGESFLSEFF
jgi:hypothetical protein